MSRQNSREVSSLEVTLNGSQIEIEPIANGTKTIDDVKVMLLKGEKGDTGIVDLSVIAPEFSASTAYAVGDLVYYDGKLYKCTTAHSAGAWNPSDFTQTTINEFFMGIGRDYVTAGRKASTTAGTASTAEGTNATASGNYSHAEGSGCIASGQHSHAEGTVTTASASGAHAEGNVTTASGSYSHAEGQNSKAQSAESHAEGVGTTASQQAAHAEGNTTTASGKYAHAEGDHSTAGHESAHAEGMYTQTGNKYQHVQGKYNVGGANTAFEIGNGTGTSARSNALSVDWSGNVTAAGTITDGTGNVLSNKLNATDPASSVAHELNIYYSPTHARLYNGQASTDLKFLSQLVTVSASNWSATVDADGYYTNSVNLDENINAYIQPLIACVGSTKDTVATSAQKAAYSLCDVFYFANSNNTDVMTVKSKTKPTETFYVMVNGINV